MELIFQGLFATSFGAIELQDCDSCDIAWLYQDAQMYGFEAYKGLIGEDNVVCPGGTGSVLDNSDPAFNDLMESCPGKRNKNSQKKCKNLTFNYLLIFQAQT